MNHDSNFVLGYFQSVLQNAVISEPAKNHLSNVYTKRNRLYHGMFHIASLWESHLSLQEIHNLPYLNGILNEAIIASFIVCHDAVY